MRLVVRNKKTILYVCILNKIFEILLIKEIKENKINVQDHFKGVDVVINHRLVFNSQVIEIKKHLVLVR